MSLDDRQVDLFSRQVLLREVGGRGQERLLASRVLVAGRGPAAESAATYLVGAGVGTVGVSGAGALEEIGFAPLAERSPEVCLVEVDPEGGIDLGEWDVSVETVETGRDLVASGRARLGSVAVGLDGEHGLTLLVVPAHEGGCAACLDPGDGVPPGRDGSGSATEVARSSPGAGGRNDATAVDLLLGGDLAALAALSLLLDLDSAPPARALRLAP
ncbi:MAG: hypothetical protein ACKOCT_13340 [Alphaproteobacteria bacterium]